MNETEADRIAAATHALRPDWPLGSLRTLLSRPELISRPRRDVAVALAWVACESQTKTPARDLEAGPWWKAAQIEAPVLRYPPKRDEACPRHPGEWPDSCRSCAADQLAGDESSFNPQRRPTNEQLAAPARANLLQAKANLCSHGIRPSTCLDKHDEPTTEPVEENA